MGGACVKAAREASESEGKARMGSRRRCRTVAGRFRFPPSRPWSTRPTRRRRRRLPPPGRSHPAPAFQPDASSPSNRGRARAQRSADAEEASLAGGTLPSVSRAAPAASAASASASADEGDAPRDPIAPASPPAAPSSLSLYDSRPRRRGIVRRPPRCGFHILLGPLRGGVRARRVQETPLSHLSRETEPKPHLGHRRESFPVPCATDAHGDAFRGVALSVFDRDFGASSEFLGGATVSPDDIPRWGQWVELTLDLPPPRGVSPRREARQIRRARGRALRPRKDHRSNLRRGRRLGRAWLRGGRRVPKTRETSIGAMDGRARGGARASNQTRPRVRGGWETSRGDRRQGSHGRVCSRAAR